MPLVPPNIEALRPYEAGRTIDSVRRQYGLTRIAKLASNENPLGASPKAVEAMAHTLGELNLYPDGGLRLREVLAAQFDLKVENVIAGSGSEGIMSNIIRAFLCDEDEVLTTEAAFIGFQVLARSRQCNTMHQNAPKCTITAVFRALFFLLLLFRRVQRFPTPHDVCGVFRRRIVEGARHLES